MQRTHDLVAAGLRFYRQPQLRSQCQEQVLRPHVRIRDIGGDKFPVQRFEQLPAQHGLAAAQFTHHFDKPLAAAQGDQQHVEGRLRALMGVKEVRVRGNRKRGFPE